MASDSNSDDDPLLDDVGASYEEDSEFPFSSEEEYSEDDDNVPDYRVDSDRDFFKHHKALHDILDEISDPFLPPNQEQPIYNRLFAHIALQYLALLASNEQRLTEIEDQLEKGERHDQLNYVIYYYRLVVKAIRKVQERWPAETETDTEAETEMATREANTKHEQRLGNLERNMAKISEAMKAMRKASKKTGECLSILTEGVAEFLVLCKAEIEARRREEGPDGVGSRHVSASTKKRKSASGAAVPAVEAEDEKFQRVEKMLAQVTEAVAELKITRASKNTTEAGVELEDVGKTGAGMKEAE